MEYLPLTNLKLSAIAEKLGCAESLETCYHISEINKWAKRKPLSSNWPEGTTAHPYGIDVNTYYSVASVLSAPKPEFKYSLKPAEGSVSYMGHFRGYLHTAKNPFGDTLVMPAQIQRGKTLTIQSLCPAASDYQMSVNDLYPASEGWRFGVILYQSNTKYFVVTDDAASLESIALSVPISNVVDYGEWRVMVILSDKAINTFTGSLPADAKYARTPFDATTIKVVSTPTEYAYSCDGFYNSTTGKVRWTFNATNNTGTSISFKLTSVRITNNAGETTKDLISHTMSVAGNASESYANETSVSAGLESLWIRFTLTISSGTTIYESKEIRSMLLVE